MRTFLAFILAAATAAAQTTVEFHTRDFGGAAQNKVLTITPTSQPIANSTNLFAGGPITATPTNGLATAALMPHSYRVSWAGLSSPITILVPVTNATLNAVRLIVTGTNVTSNTSVAYTAAASDARFAPIGSAGSGITNGQTGVTLAGTFTGNGAGLTNVGTSGALTNGETRNVAFLGGSNFVERIHANSLFLPSGVGLAWDLDANTEFYGTAEGGYFIVSGAAALVVGADSTSVLGDMVSEFGRFRGNGSGLTNLNPNGITNAPWVLAADATNAVRGVIAGSNSYSGTFTGDGSGVTNLSTTNLVGSFAASNIFAGGNFPFGTLATNTTTNANTVLVQNSNGSRRWDSSLVITNGNVGIGTTTPEDKLQVNSDGDVYLNVTAKTAVGHISGIKFQRGLFGADVYSDYAIYNSAGNLIIDRIVSGGSNNRVTILDSGNVGIGTNTPQSKLHVNGTITATGITNSGTTVLGDDVTIQGAASDLKVEGAITSGLGFVSQATNTGAVGSTSAWTNTLGKNVTFYCSSATTVALKNAAATTLVDFGTVATWLPITMQPNWYLTGTAIVGTYVAQ